MAQPLFCEWLAISVTPEANYFRLFSAIVQSKQVYIAYFRVGTRLAHFFASASYPDHVQGLNSTSGISSRFIEALAKLGLYGLILNEPSPRKRVRRDMGKPIRALIVEDSENHALLFVREFQRGGFEPEFERVETVVFSSIRERTANGETT